MKEQKPLPFQRHLELFIVWIQLVIKSFPPLWAAAEGFAPLVLARCPMCSKPRYLFWIPVGDHTLCDKLEPTPEPEPEGDPGEPLPPF